MGMVWRLAAGVLGLAFGTRVGRGGGPSRRKGDRGVWIPGDAGVDEIVGTVLDEATREGRGGTPAGRTRDSEVGMGERGAVGVVGAVRTALGCADNTFSSVGFFTGGVADVGGGFTDCDVA